MNDAPAPPKRTLPAAELVAFATAVALPTALAAWWAATDHSPPQADDLELYRLAVCLADAPLDPGDCAIVGAAPYPPLVPLLGATAFRLTGDNGIHVAVVSLVSAYAVLAGAMYVGVRRESSRFSAVVAGWLAPALWLAAGCRDAFYTEPVLAALVTASLVALDRSRGLSRPLSTTALGALIGLGLLTKWSFVFFLGPPFALALFVASATARSRRDLTGIGVAVALPAIIAGPWYLDHASELRDFLSSNLEHQYAGNVHALAESWPYYPGTAVGDLGLPLLTLAGIGILRTLFPGRDGFVGWCAAAVVSGLFFLSIAPYRTGRYLSPAYPLLAPMMLILGEGPRAPLLALRTALCAFAVASQLAVPLPLDPRSAPALRSPPGGNTRADLGRARSVLTRASWSLPRITTPPVTDVSDIAALLDHLDHVSELVVLEGVRLGYPSVKAELIRRHESANIRLVTVRANEVPDLAIFEARGAWAVDFVRVTGESRAEALEAAGFVREAQVGDGILWKPPG